MRRRTILALVAVIAAPLAFRASAIQAGGKGIAIIVNPANPTTALSRSELRQIFQTKKTSWKHGGKIMALNLAASNATRRGADSAILGLDPDRVIKYWIDRKIRGGNRPPKSIPSPKFVRKIVSKKKNAIGYLEATDVTDAVKVVARVINGHVVAP